LLQMVGHPHLPLVEWARLRGRQRTSAQQVVARSPGFLLLPQALPHLGEGGSADQELLMLISKS
jgi:hypothetical protein